MTESKPSARDLFRGSAASEMAARLRQGSRTQPQTPDSPSAPTSPTSTGQPAEQTRATDYVVVKGQLQSRLLDELAERDLLAADETRIRELVGDFVDRTLATEELPLNAHEREALSNDLIEETVGVGPLAPLMADPAVTDILVNGPRRVFVERFGKLEQTDVRFRDNDHVVRVIERIAARVGRRIDQGSPMADLRLPDGSRVNATIPPVSIDYPTLSIRRFGMRRLRSADLVRLGMLSEAMQSFLALVVENRFNIVISGGTGAGKSTLLGAVAEAVPAHERVLTIEDTAELMLDQKHVVRFETRPANVEGAGAVSIRDLVVNSLRMRPDRILVGEVRGAEALDMLQAMNTGHEGSLTTIHANSPRDALSRLETMVLLAGADLPSRAIREQVASAIHLLVHVHRFEDGVRRIASISEIAGLEESTVLLQEIFRFERHGRGERRIHGSFDATGITPRLVEVLRSRRVPIDLEMFQPPRKAGGEPVR